jgi:HAD superfamily hydrolase (TIGR01459 family)
VTVAVVHGLAELAPRYDLLVCDIWGVLHDGIVAFEAAAEALARFRAAPGAGRPRRVVLLTNAPRPGPQVRRQLDRLGVPRDAYDAIVTSGDLTRSLIAARRGEVVHYLGPERDLGNFEGLDPRFGTIEEADYVACTGLLDDERETAKDYADRLARMRARGLPMLCANPDLVVERGDRLVECAGSIALAYEEMGGEVVYAGKPHAPVYGLALERAAALDGAEPFPKERVLAIGDALRTDIAGARGQGIDSLFVARGIHAGEMDGGPPEGRAERIAAWLAGQPVRPTWVIGDLAWRVAVD